MQVLHTETVLVIFKSGFDISTRLLAQASVKTSWASENCSFFGAFFNVTQANNIIACDILLHTDM